MKKRANIVQKAVESLGFGGQSRLARKLGISPQSVQTWCSTGVIPPKRVLEVEKITGINHHQLRPDLCPQLDTHQAA